MKKILLFLCMVIAAGASIVAFGDAPTVKFYKYFSPFMEIREEMVDSVVFVTEDREPRPLYVIGGYQGWNIDGNDETVCLLETDRDIYVGYLPAAAVSDYFRFYSQLGDWETNSIGAQFEDSPIGVSMEVIGDQAVYDGGCYYGKGSWYIYDYPGDGDCRITVDLNRMSVNFTYVP